MNKEMLKHKIETCRGWKQGQIAWKEYQEIVQAARDHVSKAKALSELKLDRDVKVRKKIYRSTSDERKNRENVGLFQKEIGSLITGDMEKLRYSITFFLQSSSASALITVQLQGPQHKKDLLE